MFKHAGVACIAAAGDSGARVQFPASSADVLAVSAIGWRAAFPSDSYHTQAIREAGATLDGYFAASFSSSGPEVDVCGPGVAIVSSVPPDNFAAWDGTAVAAAHVTGLAALVLAHHRDFRPTGPYAQRTSRRVERLFEILKGSAQPFRIDDSAHTGYGLPDAARALDATSLLGSDERDSVWILQSLVAASQRTAGPTEGSPVELAIALERVGLASESDSGAWDADEFGRLTEALARAGLST